MTSGSLQSNHLLKLGLTSKLCQVAQSLVQSYCENLQGDRYPHPLWAFVSVLQPSLGKFFFLSTQLEFSQSFPDRSLTLPFTQSPSR